jgi:hypothetical protein
MAASSEVIYAKNEVAPSGRLDTSTDRSLLRISLQIHTDRKLEHTVKLKLKKEDSVLAMLGSTAIAVGLTEQDQFFSSDYEGSNLCDGLRLCVMLLSAVSCLIVIRRYVSLLELQKIRQQLSHSDNLISSKLYRMMSGELLVNMLHSPPGVNLTFDVEMMNFKMTYSLDSVMTLFLLMRIYLIVRLFSEYSKFMQQRAEMVLRWNGTEATTAFAVKGYIYENPLLSVALIFVGMSAMWSVVVMLFEQPDRHYYASYAEEKGIDVIGTSSLNSFYNCLWVVFVTTTTGKV